MIKNKSMNCKYFHFKQSFKIQILIEQLSKINKKKIVLRCFYFPKIYNSYIITIIIIFNLFDMYPLFIIISIFI